MARCSIGPIYGELLVNIFIQKTEEQALEIDQNTTEMYRRDNQIPDSDGFAIEAHQRQCPPIYLISITQIGPNMQVYQRLY